MKLRYLTFVICALISVRTASAERLILQGFSDFAVVKNSDNGLSLSGKYSIENKGDELAKHVSPIFEIDQPLWSGDPKSLNAGNTEVWNVEAKISESIGKRRGVIPLKVSRMYRDANDYKFSAREILLMTTPDLSNSERASLATPRLRSRVTVTSSGQHFDGDIEIENISGEILQLRLSTWCSLEISLNIASPQLSLEPGETKKIRVSGKNFSGLNGSHYPINILMQWSHAGLEEAEVRTSIVDIYEEKNSIGKMLLIAVIALMALITATLILLKKRDRLSARTDQKGTALLEFVIFAPLLILFSLQMYEVSSILYHHSVLTNIAREAARFGSTAQATSITIGPLVSTKVQSLYTTGAAPTWQQRLRFAGTLTTSATMQNSDLIVTVTGTFRGVVVPWTNFPVVASASVPKL